MSSPSRIWLSFGDELGSAEVELLWNKAPKTCQALSQLSPISGVSHHAIYSGSECVLLLPEVIRLTPENAYSKVTRGEVGFTWFAAGSAYGVSRDFAEIMWFYDLDAEPRMWEGPVAVNIFGRIVEPADEFYATCRRMRTEGAKPCQIRTAMS